MRREAGGVAARGTLSPEQQQHQGPVLHAGSRNHLAARPPSELKRSGTQSVGAQLEELALLVPATASEA